MYFLKFLENEWLHNTQVVNACKKTTTYLLPHVRKTSIFLLQNSEKPKTLSGNNGFTLYSLSFLLLLFLL